MKLEARYVGKEWKGKFHYPSDRDWDKRLPDCWNSVPQRTMRYVARTLANFSGRGPRPALPSGWAGHMLHGMLWCGARDGGEKTRVAKSRVIASMLMGLAEDGDWTP
jgi:hypothetical protein